MPAMDFQGSSSPLVSFGRSIVSNRRDTVMSTTASTTSMDGAPHIEGGRVGLDELEAFQRLVAELFHGLGGGEQEEVEEEILSLRWVRKLLESFLLCQEEFGKILAGKKAALSKSPLDRLTSDFSERSVKALDVCNAIRDGIDHVRNWVKHLEIVHLALDPKQRSLGEGQFRRAKKALTDLTIAMLDEKEASSSSSVFARRNRSFGQNNRENHRSAAVATLHFRSLSWSVSRNWSAARQLQAIGSNLAAPRSNEIIATNGLAVPIFTMNSVLLFVMWALVAAIPCQDRGLQMHFSIPRGFVWAAPVLSLHERIVEESKKRSRKNSNGLLNEIHRIEKCSRHLTELMDSIQLPIAKDKESEFKAEVEELAKICGAMKDGLDPLERQVREVFYRIVRGRTEGLDSLGMYSGRH